MPPSQNCALPKTKTSLPTRGGMIPFFTGIGIGIGITTKGVGIGIAWNRLFVGIDSKLESTQFQNGVGIGITVFHKMPKI